MGEPRGASGIVHIYQRAANAWRASSMLKAPDAAANDGFGSSVAADGNLLLVGQATSTTSADGGRGHGARLHAQRQRRVGVGRVCGRPSSRGRAPASAQRCTSPGDVAMVGAPAYENGAVFLYRRGANGAWAPAGRLTVEGLAEGDAFGAAIAADGDRVVVGAPGRSSGKGAVFAFARNAAGEYAQTGMVVAAAGNDGARLGSSVALKGNRLVAGAPGAYAIAGRRASSMGSVTVFEYSEIAEIWKEKQTFVPFQAGSARFGQTVAMAGDEVWIGAPSTQYNTGAVYRMRPRPTARGASMRTLEVPGVEPGASFGATLAVAGNTAAVGMPTDAGGAGTVMFLVAHRDGRRGRRAARSSRRPPPRRTRR